MSFAFTYESESLELLYGDVGLNSCSVDSDELMKRGDAPLNVS